MKAFTVDELQKFKLGTSFELTHSRLTGTLKLITIDDSEQERGTLLLCSQTISIPCLIDFIHYSFLNQTIYINNWVYVNNHDLGVMYIEFKANQIYKDLACEHALFSEFLTLEQQVFENCQVSFYEPSLFLSSELIEPIHLVGIVTAISVLYIKPNTHAVFFIDISNQQQTTTSIMFFGNELIKYYASFQIGIPYTFQYLALTMIGQQKHLKKTLFSFKETQSACHLITLDQFHHQIQVTLPTSDMIDKPLHVTQRTTVPKSTYTGTITRVIDSMFGIYELDNQLLLCLFHHLGYSASIPYRVNTRIRLHHIHLASIQPEDGNTNYLFKSMWKAPLNENRYLVLVGCMKSHVDILKMAENHEIQETDFIENDTIKEFIYMDSLQRHFNFSQLIRQLEIFAALKMKFSKSELFNDLDLFKHAFYNIQRQVFKSTKTRLFMQEGDFINDFFLHDKFCSTVGNQLIDNTLHMTLDAYPSIQNIHYQLQERLQDYHLNLAGSQENRFEMGHVHTQLASYDQNDNYCILGEIQVAQDGRFYLADNETSILIHISTYDFIQAGDIYLVRKMDLIKENLSYMQDKVNAVEKKSLWCTYFNCHAHDLIALYNYLNRPFFQTRDDTQQVHRYQLTSPSPLFNQRQLKAIHVLDTFPIQTSFDADGSLYFEARVVVRMVGVQRSIKESTYCVLVLNSKQNSLIFHPYLQVGTRWMVCGLDDDEFVLNGDCHRLYPISIHKTTLTHALELEPQTIRKPPKDKPIKIYSVTELIEKTNKDEKLSNSMYKNTVNVRGVIVTKRLDDGYPSNDMLLKDKAAIYQQFGVGTGKANRKIFLQLRQTDSLDSINIYVDAQHMYYPLGLIVGSDVTIYNLIRKARSGDYSGFFGVANENCWIQVNRTMPTPEMLNLVIQQPVQLISSFLDPILGLYEDTSDQIFKIFCSIQSILSISMKWECQDCGSIVRDNDCYGMCKNPSRVFITSAFIQVSDGTGSAYVSIDGERLIARLLQLNPQQMDRLKTLAMKHGELAYGTWEESEALNDLCQKAKGRGQFWLYGRATKTRELEQSKQNHIKNLHLQRINISDNHSLLRTLEFKKLKIHAIELEFPDPRLVAYELLKKISL